MEILRRQIATLQVSAAPQNPGLDYVPINISRDSRRALPGGPMMFSGFTAGAGLPSFKRDRSKDSLDQTLNDDSDNPNNAKRLKPDG